MKKLNILFVCSGNTCRSPMAEAYVNFKYSKNKAINITAKSAGLYALGDPINPNSANALSEYGIPSSSEHNYKRHISHTVNTEDMEWADKVICMTGEIALRLIIAAPVYKRKITAYKGSVGDPYGGSEEEYIACLDEIVYQTDRILPDIIRDEACKDIVYRSDALTDEEINIISECERYHFTDACSAEALRSMLRSDFYAVAAFDGKEICGFGYIYTALDEAELLRIAVNEKYRGLKIGATILSRLHDAAKSKGCCKIFLEVRKSNENAIRLYEGSGYERTGVRKNFYKDPREDAILYKKVLT